MNRPMRMLYCGPKQIALEDSAFPAGLVVALNVVNRKVVAQSGLRNMNVGGGPILFAVPPRKVPFSLAKEPPEPIAAILVGSLRWARARLGMPRRSRHDHREQACLN